MLQQSQQLILRLPHELAERVRAIGLGSIEVRHAEDSAMPDKFSLVLQPEQTPALLFPALLCNLPCPLETHRTVDKKTLYKSANIGQILVVFITEADLLHHYHYNMHKFEGIYYNHCGLTVPTMNIIKRKFSKTRKTPYVPPDIVRNVLNEIIKFNVVVDLYNNK